MRKFLNKIMRRATRLRPSVRTLESDSLAATEMQVRLALEASGAAMWIIDYTRGARERFDARSCELADLDPKVESWPPNTFCNLLHPDDRAIMQAACTATHASAGRGPLVEYRIVRADGEMRWLQGAGIVRRDAHGRVRQFIGVSVDVTERKRLESELRATIDKLADADRRKDEFLATLAHELRNPLAPIRNGVQILKLSMGDDETLVRTVGIMERQTSHLVRLVDDLLDLSRITRGTVQLRTARLALSEVLSGALESVHGPSSAKQVELTVRMADEPLSIDGDRDRLTQVFSNLLLNAVKYTEPGGRIELASRREGSDAVVSVTDTGIGIPQQALEHIFEMFSRVRPVEAGAPGRGEGGLGIGLALVRQLVEMHGGAVTARSEGPGRGAEFIVRLPALAERAASPAAAPVAGRAVEHAREARSEPSMSERSASIPASTGRRILVVDDHADGAASLEALLRMLGHEVRQARDGIEAIEVAQVFEPDMIFMDIGMPRLNGLDAARRIRELPLATRPSIVALTGWGQEADRKRSEQAGIDGHLVKPVELAALHRVLDSTG